MVGLTSVQGEPEKIDAYDYVCEQVTNVNPEWNCDGLPPPIVVMSSIVHDHRYNLFGNVRGLYYPGERYIFVASGLKPEDAVRIVVHEMTHYVLHANAPEMERCEQEELARFVAGQSDEGWRELYNCRKE